MKTLHKELFDAGLELRFEEYEEFQKKENELILSRLGEKIAAGSKLLTRRSLIRRSLQKFRLKLSFKQKRKPIADLSGYGSAYP